MKTEVQPTSVSTCVVRTAVVGDIPALLVLYHELHETHRVQHPELFPATVATDPAAVERMLRDNRVAFLVAEFESATGAKLAAFLRVVDTLTPEGGALLSRRFGLVDEVVVLPEYRRLGLPACCYPTRSAGLRSAGCPPSKSPFGRSTRKRKICISNAASRR